MTTSTSQGKSTTSAEAGLPAADFGEISHALQMLHPADRVIELRALAVSTPRDRRPHTVSGYFLDHQALAAAAAELSSQAAGVYITLNDINPALLARAVNRARVVGEKDPTTADHDVVRRKWLPIDCDPVRPAGISSSDEERDQAFERAGEIREYLWSEGWDTPVLADSGNGAHLLYRIDLPPDDGGHVRQILADLGRRFSDSTVTVDQTVYNPARIWKLYGTLARKGDHAPIVNRPHRLARIIEVPD